MINNDNNTTGIYKAVMLDKDSNNDIRVWVPAISSIKLATVSDNKYNITSETIKKYYDVLPKANMAKFYHGIVRHREVETCWVVFENGDMKYPVIVGYQGQSIREHEGDSYSSEDNSGYKVPFGDAPDTIPTGGEVIDNLWVSNGWAWPIEIGKANWNTLSSGYNESRVNSTGKTGYHAGIDIAIGCPNDILATNDGTVSTAGWLSGYGNCVIIDHSNGIQSLYGHMCKTPSVTVNQTVSRGTVLGCIGSTGNSSGNHLHFEFRVNKSHTNPFAYVTRPSTNKINLQNCRGTTE